jgi:hypothetical protein
VLQLCRNSSGRILISVFSFSGISFGFSALARNWAFFFQAGDEEKIIYSVPTSMVSTD